MSISARMMFHPQLERLEDRTAPALTYSLFAQTAIPVGVAVDQTGVFVDGDSTNNRVITGYNFDGSVGGGIFYGNFFTLLTGRMTPILGEAGQGYHLLSDGTLSRYDFSTRTLTPLLNLKALPTITSNIWDAALGTFNPSLGSVVLPGAAQTQYGDISVFDFGDGQDFFVSGLSVAFPFVTRVRFDTAGNFVESRVIASSSASTAGDSNETRGVAVNNDGMVLTTLPIDRGNLANFDAAFAWRGDFPDDPNQAPRMLLNGEQLSTFGVGTDPIGNFYLGTGPSSTSLIGGNSGIVAISRSLDRVEVAPISTSTFPLRDIRDVAIHPNGQVGFAVSARTNEVFAFGIPDDLFPAPPPAPPPPPDAPSPSPPVAPSPPPPLNPINPIPPGDPGSPITLTNPNPHATPLLAVGADAGGPPAVRVFDARTGEQLASMTVADTNFTGGVRTVMADVTGNGRFEVITALGPGGEPRVRILDSEDGSEVRSFLAFEQSFTGGVFVQAADLTGNGVAELIVSPDQGGGPRIQILDGQTGKVIANFFGIKDTNFRGGARVGIGDIDGDGTPDLIVGAGFGGGPRVAIFDGRKILENGFTQNPDDLKFDGLGDFFVFENTLRNGVFVTGGDLTGDGHADLIVGGGPGGGPRIFALSGADLIDSGTRTQVANFFGGDTSSRGGIRVTVKDVDGDSHADLVIGAGEGAGSRVTVYRGADITTEGTPPEEQTFDAFDDFPGGVFVG